MLQRGMPGNNIYMKRNFEFLLFYILKIPSIFSFPNRNPYPLNSASYIGDILYLYCPIR